LAIEWVAFEIAGYRREVKVSRVAGHATLIGGATLWLKLPTGWLVVPPQRPSSRRSTAVILLT
jgi:hypothetical protein